MRLYGRYGGSKEDDTRCIVEVSEPPHYIHYYQCRRKRGHGPGGLYCKQHAKIVKQGGRYVPTGRVATEKEA